MYGVTTIWWFGVRIAAGSKFFTSSELPNLLLYPPSVLLIGYRAFFSGVKEIGDNVLMAPMIRMSWAIHLPSYMPLQFVQGLYVFCRLYWHDMCIYIYIYLYIYQYYNIYMLKAWLYVWLPWLFCVCVCACVRVCYVVLKDVTIKRVTVLRCVRIGVFLTDCLLIWAFHIYNLLWSNRLILTNFLRI